MIIYARQNRYYIQDGINEFSLHESELDFQDQSTRVQFIFDRWPPEESRSKLNKYYDFADIKDRYGNAYGTTFQEIIDGIHSGVDVNLQDQTTDPIIQKFNRVTNSTTVSVLGVIDEREITVADTTGIIAGSHVILFHPGSERFSSFTALGVLASVVTVDSPLDFAYPVGTFVDIGTTQMAVDGSTTPVTFGLRGAGAPPGVDITMDLTRIIITLLSTNAPEFDLFGDQTALTNGLLMRIRNGKYFNIFNVKSNGGWAGLMYDLSAADKVNPNLGQNGWVGRMTFAGQNKMGVAIRLPIGEDVEFIVQDNLTGLVSLEIVAEGHIVKE